MKIFAKAIEIFGSRASAEEWLKKPSMALEQRMPIDLLSTPEGIKIIEEHLTRFEYGIYM